jgi:hypothetical protein
VEKKHLYLRKDLLLEKIGKHHRSVTIRAIINCLKSKDALVSSAIQLHGAGNGCRFLSIPLDALSKR